MNNEQLKLGMKITITIALIILGILIGILIFVFNAKDSRPDIYSDLLENTNKDVNSVDVAGITLESNGINTEEFKSYLTIFGFLAKGYPEISDKEEKNTQELDTAIAFLNTLYSYEKDDESSDEIITYDAEEVNKVLKELRGSYISEAIKENNNYLYNEESKNYTPNNNDFEECLLIKIDEATVEKEQINVKYKVAFVNSNEREEYQKGSKIELKTYDIEATILENKDFEYSKYYVSDIKTISKENVKYN